MLINQAQLDKTSKIADSLPEPIKKHTEQVLYWLWCKFPDKPDRETITELKELGFHWNHKRKVWQNHCGWRSRHAPYDPRQKYGAVPLVQEEEIAA